MSYQGYLIANFETGFDRERQPWLLPDDAQFQLFDGYVYRGVWQKREGYSQYSTGQRGGAAYCESRMVHRITAEAYSTGNGTKGPYTHTEANLPVRRGTVTITAGGQSAVDNGIGGFITTPAGGSGSIDYTTGVTSITFQNVVAGATPITITYDYHQGFPVMGVMNFYTQTNTRELIVADTTYVNRFNSTTNRLDDITPAVPLTGDKTNFITWVNYPDAENLQRLLFVNFKDPVQQYSGSTITPYPIYTDSIQITTAASGVVGNGTTGPYVINTPANTGIVPGTLSVIDPTTPQTITFDEHGNASGDGIGTVNFLLGNISVTFNSNVGVGDPINLTYKQLNTPITTALHISQFKDRLVVEYTIENSVQYGHRIRISGTGAFCDVFTIDAIGAGVIDIPADTFISSSDFNRDDRLIFLQNESWLMKFSGSDVVPFTLDRLDGTRGSAAPYGTITYLNRTNAVSPLGFILTDGYSVERADDKIPDYSYNEIDQDNFGLCFAGSVDVDRDHYLIHPSNGQSQSDRILITNYEEDNYSIYRIPLSCMGNYIVSFDITWNDLIGPDPANPIYPSWDALASVYGNWNAFAYSKGAPISIGGGHEGQIVLLNNIETEDYPVKIRNITVIDSSTLQVTTDFQNYSEGDFVAIESALGMTEVNNKQAPISQIISPYVFNLSPIDTTTFSAYTSGGVASKCIVFDCKTKKFNPFANADKKVTCGWMYFYVSTSGTDLTVNQSIFGATQSNPCILYVPGHGYNTGQQVYVNGVQGMVELNGIYYYITVIDDDYFSLDGIDSTGFTTYTSAGFVSIPDQAVLQVRCISNDTEQSTQLNGYNPAPYQVNLTNMESENGIKKWYKLWINQTARFVQFEVINNQSGAMVQIHAMMPGFAPTGRLI